MKLLSFQYLSHRRVLTLAVTAMLSSMLFSMTAISLLGFYRGFNAYLGEGEDVVVVYDRRSSTPFTGLVPAYLAERISMVNGVLASSPEVIAPCIVKGESVFLRGIVPEDFFKLSRLKMVEGEVFELGDVDSAIVGRNVAERLKLKLGEVLLVHGVLADRYVELRVMGVYDSQSFMDDEVLAPIYVGQWLRGTDYDHVTLIRVKIDRRVLNPIVVLEALAEEASEPTPPSSEGRGSPEETIMPRVTVRFRAEDVGIEEAARFMKSYMERYGVTRESLLTLSVMVFLFSSATIIAASKTLVVQHAGEVKVLRSLGASKKLLKMDILAKLLPWLTAATLAGIALAVATLTVIQGYGCLRVLSHTVPVQLDPLVIALSFALTILLSSISIIKSEIP